jgi:hypothetical protein
MATGEELFVMVAIGADGVIRAEEPRAFATIEAFVER